ncbi:MAG: porin [Flavipsychrobacter sp.]|jgi:outer membrane protein OmpA-like peptidoglycan-associated protein|nr:porin [Flavipsychrobacter sp.]
MKKLLLFFFALAAAQVKAQNINPEGDYAPARNEEAPAHDSLNTGWYIDINATGGGLWQSLRTINQAAYYTNALNANISRPEFRNGVSRGLEVQGAYFFGKKRNFGVGSGLMYMYQEGDYYMDNFHVEYRSTDNFTNTFRQVLTSNGRVKESVRIHNLNIPVVFKYQVCFSKKVGFTADAGFLINLLQRNNYSTNTTFDYEAIYKYSGSQGEIVPVYDDSPTPDADDLLLTKSYASAHGLNSQAYINDLRNRGYNVGLGVRPTNNSGHVNYDGSIGLLLRPAISLYLSEHVALNLGMYYTYQLFTHGTGNYRMTDKVGTYNSMLNSISRAHNHSLGVNIGVRYNFRRSAAPQPEPAPEPEVEPEPEPEPVVVPEPEEPQEEVDVEGPILFDVNKATIKKQAVPILEKAARKAKSRKATSVEIHGYTDNTGDPAYNKELSKKRAAAVKNYLTRKGVKPGKMETVGHGPKNPAATNRTQKGRTQNRRVILKLKSQK